MRILTETRLLFQRKMIETIRQPVWVFMGLVTPLLYIALFSPLLKNLNGPAVSTGAVLTMFVPGILVLLSFSCGTGAGYSVIFELQSGVIERLRVSPASRFSLLMGSVLRDVTTCTVPSLLVVIIAALFGFQVYAGALLVMFLLLSLLTVTVSAWFSGLGLLMKRTNSLAALIAGLELPLTLLSGILLPLSLGPVWLRTIAHLNPLYYAVEAARVLAAGTIRCPEVYQAFAVMIPLAALSIVWSTRVYQKAIA